MQTNAPQPVQAVLFDYGLVLTGPPLAAAWQKMRDLTGHDEPTLHAAYWTPRHEYDRGTHTGREYWRMVAAHNNPNPVAEETIDRLIAADNEMWTQPNQPMIDWAIALQRAGIRTGILSNLGDEMMHGVLAKFDWVADFHHRTWSHTLLLAKPEPAIYAHAAAGLETPPANILFLDDREDNIAAAHATGMQTLRYTTHEAFVEEMHSRGLGSLLDPQPAAR